MLTFVMGTVGLENPMDKRYFYATDADGKIVAFIVFVPFLGKRGYMADVTRHGTGGTERRDGDDSLRRISGFQRRGH